jgi:hypothetical protein
MNTMHLLAAGVFFMLINSNNNGKFERYFAKAVEVTPNADMRKSTAWLRPIPALTVPVPSTKGWVKVFKWYA